MAKKNLKTALASHTLRRAQKEHQEKVQAAQSRKAHSISGGGSAAANKKQKKKQKIRRVEEGVVESEGSLSGTQNADGRLLQQEVDASAVVDLPVNRSFKGKARSVEPFLPDDTILLVGEGDFSFTLSLLLPPHSHSPTRLIATSFDSQSSCLSKYPLASSHLDQIRSLCPDGVDILRFNVDAGALQADKLIRRWLHRSQGFTKVWFGFPHVGMGHKDEKRNVLANQLLLLRFLVSVAPLLSKGEKPKHALLNQQGGGGKRKGPDGDDDDDDADADDDEDEDAHRHGRSMKGDQDRFDDVWDDGHGVLTSALDESDVADSELMDDNLADVPLPHEIDYTPITTTLDIPDYPPRSPSRAGSVLVTLRQSKPYTLWQLPHLATRLTSMLPLVVAAAPALPKGMRAPELKDVRDRLPAIGEGLEDSGKRGAGIVGSGAGGAKRKDQGYDVWRSFQFHPREWKGYRHVRTIGAKEGSGGKGGGGGGDLLSSKEGDEEAICRTWELGLRD